MFGVLVHDMNIDKAAKVAITPITASVAGASTIALDNLLTKSEHTHAERASTATHFNSSLPKVRPPRDDDRQYKQNRKQEGLGGDDHTYLWPSV